MLIYDEVSVRKLIMLIFCVSIGLVVSVKVVHGELEQATKENPLLLKNVCITKKLGFSDVIMPGDVRYSTEFYFDSMSLDSNRSVENNRSR